MPNRADRSRNTMIDLLTRVPVNRGGLIKSIDHLLKTIETSENAVMIPTLLKDKVRVDAWELLFVAKILKASVLGHSDLVEFYLNHIHNNSSHAGAAAAAAGTLVDDQTPMLSPQSSPILRQQSSPAMSVSPVLARNNNNNNNNNNNHSQPPPAESLVHESATINGNDSAQSHSSASSVASSTTTTTTTGGGGGGKGTTSSRQSSSMSWTTATANSQQQQQQRAGASLSSSPFTSACNSITATVSGASSSASSSDGGATCTTTSTTSQQQHANGITCPVAGLVPPSSPPPPPPPARVATFQISDCSPPAASPNADTNSQLVDSTAAQVNVNVNVNVRPPPPPPVSPVAVARHPQPPSLLQLTTTNNHINSVSEMFNTNSPLSPSLEQLTSHLFQLQQQSQQQQHQHQHQHQLTPDQVPLSISTSAQPTQLAPVSEYPQSAGTTPSAGAPPPTRHELRSSRSAGCLFRANSGASSPRTAGTPLPQAETLSGAPPTGLVGDPSSLVKLLLQVEQLKTSIVQVTSLLDSVVELYKKSIDNIAT